MPLDPDNFTSGGRVAGRQLQRKMEDHKMEVIALAIVWVITFVGYGFMDRRK